MHVNFSQVKSDDYTSMLLKLKTYYLRPNFYKVFTSNWLWGSHTLVVIQSQQKIVIYWQVKPLFQFQRWYPLFYSTGKGQRKPELQHLHVAKPMKFCTVPCKKGTFLFRSGWWAKAINIVSNLFSSRSVIVGTTCVYCKFNFNLQKW